MKKLSIVFGLFILPLGTLLAQVEGGYEHALEHCTKEKEANRSALATLAASEKTIKAIEREQCRIEALTSRSKGARGKARNHHEGGGK